MNACCGNLEAVVCETASDGPLGHWRDGRRRRCATFIRCLVDSAISGVALSPYLPFVVMAALLIGWRPAVATALASAAVADMLFIDPRYVPMAGPTDLFAIAVFLVCAALIIVIVPSARVIVENCPGPLPREHKATGIIFSLEKGQAWAAGPEPAT